MTLEEMEQRIAEAVAPYDMTAMIMDGSIVEIFNRNGRAVGFVGKSGTLIRYRIGMAADALLALKAALEGARQ